MPGGYVGILSVELHFPEAGSLKGKRKHVKSAKAQLQNRFGASVAEVEHHELWQRARLTVELAPGHRLGLGADEAGADGREHHGGGDEPRHGREHQAPPQGAPWRRRPRPRVHRLAGTL